MVLATRCGFPATAPLAERVDCKDDQDGHGQDVQNDYQDGQDVQDDYQDDQDVLDSAFVINMILSLFLVTLIFSHNLSSSFPGAFSILSASFHYKQM